uniref:Uncharacterized protein n=1 Tax=Magallana gigas TaxID=29159 RepID=A0A8W8JRL3_MAGGI
MDSELSLTIEILGEKKRMKDKTRGDHLIPKHASLSPRMGSGRIAIYGQTQESKPDGLPDDEAESTQDLTS